MTDVKNMTSQEMRNLYIDLALIANASGNFISEKHWLQEALKLTK